MILRANMVLYRLNSTPVTQKSFDNLGLIDEETIPDGVDAHMLHISGVFNATGQILDYKKYNSRG